MCRGCFLITGQPEKGTWQNLFVAFLAPAQFWQTPHISFRHRGDDKDQKNTCSNIARTANAVQCHSLLSGHYDCNVLMFSIVRNVNNFTTSLGLPFVIVSVLVR